MTGQDVVYDVGVIHGRFQVLHNDHVRYLLSSMEHCRHLVVGITNAEPDMIHDETADPQRSTALGNPLTYYERYQLVRSGLVESGVELNDFSIVPLPISQPERYRYYVPLDAVFFLSIYDDWGRRKKQYFESLGLTTHVLREVTPAEKGISGTDVRQRIMDGEPWHHLVPASVAALLENWNIATRLRDIQSDSDAAEE
jgi:nicotinamide-nucleotide adenylyltransferase